MLKVNPNYEKLPGSYLFAEIARRVKEYTQAHPDADVIRLGIGDVTRPLAPAVVEAFEKAVREMGCAETVRWAWTWLSTKCSSPTGPNAT